jgi:hypothetical protein
LHHFKSIRTANFEWTAGAEEMLQRARCTELDIGLVGLETTVVSEVAIIAYQIVTPLVFVFIPANDSFQIEILFCQVTVPDRRIGLINVFFV